MYRTLRRNQEKINEYLSAVTYVLLLQCVEDIVVKTTFIHISSLDPNPRTPGLNGIASFQCAQKAGIAISIGSLAVSQASQSDCVVLCPLASE